MARTDGRTILKDIKYIDFDLDEEITGQEGRLFWNLDDGTLNLGLPGGAVNLQIGQENLIRVTNEEGSDISNGEPVYISGSTGNNPKIKRALASEQDNNRKTLAIATENIVNGQKGYVTTFGLVRDVNTNGMTGGQELYVGVSGGFTNTRPDLPNGITRVGYCIRVSEEEGIIFVNIANKSIKDLLVDSGDLTIRTEDNKTIVLEKSVYRDINLGAAQFSLPVASRPDAVQYVDSTGTSTGIYALGFGVGEKISGQFELQHDYKEGTDLSFHIHWQGIVAPAGGSDNVRWQLEYTVSNNGDALSPKTTIVIQDTIITQYGFKTTSFADIIGTNYGIGDQFLFTLTRIAASSDEYAGDAIAATIGVHYEIDTIGSRQRTSK